MKTLGENELNELAEFLDAEDGPDDRLTFSAFDGFAAGLAVAPSPLSALEWSELALGEQGGVPDNIVSLMERHIAYVRETVRENGDELAPVFELVDEEQDEVSPVEWCAGFLLATDLFPDAFSAVADDEEAVNLMLPIVVFGTEEGIAALEDQAEDGFAESLLEAIAPSVVGLARYLGSRP